MATRQIMPVLCPVCNTRFTAPVDSIVDVGRNPALKARFLRGQINVARCPQCGNEGVMNTPLFYHDAAHELALVLMPVELNLHHNDQQRIIGDMTNALLNSLPPEQRKGYLLTPQVFFTLQSLTDRVYQAEGITPEMLEKQRAKAKLIETFLQAKDEDALRTLVSQHDAELDYEFFQVLTASAQAAQTDGSPELARALLGLRTFLAERSSSGRAAMAELNAAMGLGETITREELLKRLQEAKSDEEWEMLVAAGRPLLDYAFFQNLTAQIDSAPDADTAARLKALRTRILDTTAQQDEEMRVALQEAADLLKTILQATDPQAIMRQNHERLDDLFFGVLAANMQQAQADKRNDWVEKLRQIGDMATAVLQEHLPPEVRLVQQLLQAAYPDGTRQLLTEQRTLVTPQFLQALETLVTDLQSNGRSKAAEHVRQVLEQAKTITESPGVLRA
jgi:hypothetical protein